MVQAFCDQVVAKLDEKSCVGKRNHEVWLDFAREKCTGQFYIVDSEGFHGMH